MLTARNSHLRAPIHKSALLLVWSVLLSIPAYGQLERQPSKQTYKVDTTDLANSIVRLKSGDFFLVDIENIASANAVETIPILKEQFVSSQDLLTKAKIANALVRLGDKDDTYWDFLVKLVTPIVESAAPNFMSYDPQGKSVPEPSPEFVVWAKANNAPPNAGEDSVYIVPGKVMLLGSTGDSRAIPLLRQALMSPNHMTEIAAALGLAEIKDKDSIPLIIEACKRAPAEAAASIATSLVYFDDSQAQGAVDTYMPKDQAKVYREARANGKTPFH